MTAMECSITKEKTWTVLVLNIKAFGLVILLVKQPTVLILMKTYK